MNNCHLAELVVQEGWDAAAEERIVKILADKYMDVGLGAYIDTDRWRHRIRKAQGRSNRG